MPRQGSFQFRALSPFVRAALSMALCKQGMPPEPSSSSPTSGACDGKPVRSSRCSKGCRDKAGRRQGRTAPSVESTFAPMLPNCTHVCGLPGETVNVGPSGTKRPAMNTSSVPTDTGRCPRRPGLVSTDTHGCPWRPRRSRPIPAGVPGDLGWSQPIPAGIPRRPHRSQPMAAGVLGDLCCSCRKAARMPSRPRW